jgi:hypoxanthine-guanine phosphoribosyltransferase
MLKRSQSRLAAHLHPGRKRPKEQLDVPVDYLGFKIPDVWVVGYGLDYADKHRTLPYIAELKPSAYGKSD